MCDISPSRLFFSLGCLLSVARAPSLSQHNTLACCTTTPTARRIIIISNEYAPIVCVWNHGSQRCVARAPKYGVLAVQHRWSTASVDQHRDSTAIAPTARNIDD